MAEDLIGKGAYGSVYKVIKSGETVALKEIRMEHFIYFKKEVRALRHLKGHENIINIIDAYETHQLTCEIILEYLEGIELYNAVVDKTLDKKNMHHIVREMARGIEHMHSHGVLHRDLKLENCMIVSTNHIKWIDFGFAHMYTKSSETLYSRCGSRSYCAPEVVNRAYSGYASDMWSLGICLFAMFYEYFPFNNCALSDPIFKYIYSKHETCNIKELSKFQTKGILNMTDIPPDAITIIELLLTRDPVKRITIDDVLNSAWLRDVERRDSKCKHISKYATYVMDYITSHTKYSRVHS